jgi:3-oxoacyl-[acyl-carrier protein] reductase
MSKPLAGKTALVTGGSRGIGAAIAKKLAEDGADVVITYVSSPQKADEVVKAIEKSGQRGGAIQADSADAEAVRSAVDEAVKKLGKLDILVNNAGIAIIKPQDEFSIEDFDRITAVNIRAVFVGSQAAAKHLGDGGRIITIGSISGEESVFTGLSLYSMTKAAVAGLTRGFARDLGAKGITVNVVQPGPIGTDLNPLDGPFSELITLKTALGRYGTTEEVASLVAYLASPEAAYITGASFTIDGGLLA